MSKAKRVYQFKITLLDTKPPIWRRIQVAENYRFWDLHMAIQNAMGWQNCHLHQFTIYSPKEMGLVEIGLGEEDFNKLRIFERVSKHFSLENTDALYWYDFGDDWNHKVTLEKIIPADPKHTYPRCIAGKRACPPEDSGGVWGFYEMLNVLEDPEHEEHEDLLEWLGDAYDPEHFDPKEVLFEDPKESEKAITSLY